VRFMPSTRRSETSFANVTASTFAAARLGAALALAAWPVLIGRVMFYLLILVVLAALSVIAVERRLEDDIRNGGLEPYLLRPQSYLLQRVAPAIGETMVRLVALGTAGLVALAISGRPLPTPGVLLALIVLGSLGCVVGTLLYVLVGLAAFWMRRVLPAMLIVQKLSFLLGGLVAPISLYPNWLFGIAKATPFGAHLYWVAVQTMAPSARLFWIGIGWQILWSTVLGALCTLVWRAGLRKALREGL
jgi:ABC-2 type transport system permease protein